MKYAISIFASVMFVAFVVIAAPSAAFAQEDVSRLLKQLEDDSDRFSNSATKALDNSKYDGTPLEDQLVRYVREFEDSIDRLKKASDKSEPTAIPAKEVMTRAKAVDKFMRRNTLSSAAETDWITVKADLARLARAYNLKPLA